MEMHREESLENHDPNGQNHEQRVAPRNSKLELIRKIATAKIEEGDSSDEEDGDPSQVGLKGEKSKSIESGMDAKLKDILNKYGAMPGPNMPLLDHRADKKKANSMGASETNKRPKKNMKKIQNLALSRKKRQATKKAADEKQKKECQKVEVHCPALPTRFLGKEVYGAVIGKSLDITKGAKVSSNIKEDSNAIALKAPQSFKKSSLTKKGSEIARDSRRYAQKPTSTSNNDKIATVSSDKSKLKYRDLTTSSGTDQKLKCDDDEEQLCQKMLQARVDSIISGGCLISTEEIAAAIKIQSAERAFSAVRLLSANKSALKIQTLWRTFHYQSSYKNYCQSALLIQSNWRMYNARRNFLGSKSAIKIQAAWRCINARREFLHHQATTQASIVIQTAWRSFYDQCSYLIILHGIFHIQAIVRGHLARKFCGILMKRRRRRKLLRDSATTIQKQIRGYLGRAKCQQIRQLELDNDLAIRIQTTWRRYYEQRKFAYTMASVVKVQSFARASIQQIRFLSILYYAITIQSTLRRFLAQKRFMKKMEVYKANKSATLIQATWRAKVSREYYQVHHKAKMIQKTWRMFLNRRDFLLYKKVRDIQATWRRYAARVKYNNTLIAINAATKIQTTCRTFLCQSDYIFTLMDIMTIQRVARGAMGRTVARNRRQYLEMKKNKEKLRKQSALTIQRIYRGHLGRAIYSYVLQEHEFYNAATAIQTAWRSYDAEQTFYFKLDCIVHIQSIMRGALERTRVIEYLVSITVAQTAVRRWLAIRKTATQRKLGYVLDRAKKVHFKENRAAAILQLFYQKEVKGASINRHATKVQSFFRMVKAVVDLELLKDEKRRKERKERKERRRARKNQEEAEVVLSSQEIFFSSQETIATQQSTDTDALSYGGRPRRYCKPQARRPVSRNRAERIAGSPSLTSAKNRTERVANSRSLNSVKKTVSSFTPLSAVENQRGYISSGISNSQLKNSAKARSVHSMKGQKKRLGSTLVSSNIQVRSDSPLKSQLVPGLLSSTAETSKTVSVIQKGTASNRQFRQQLNPGLDSSRSSSTCQGGRKAPVDAPPFLSTPPPIQVTSSRRSRSRCRAEAFNNKSQELLERTRSHSRKINQRKPSVTLPRNI